MSVMEHVCMACRDPRKNGRCAGCGGVMETPAPLIRSLEFERGVVEQACKGYVDPSDILERAERRSLTLSHGYVENPMHVQPGKNRRREAREELEDFLNHLRWDSYEHLEDEERCWENLEAIRLVCMAYDKIGDRDR